MKIVETVVPPYTELKEATVANYIYNYTDDLGYKLFREQFPCLDADDVYFDQHYKGTYNDYENDFIKYLCNNFIGILIDNSDYENMSFTGTQTIPIENHGELVYEFMFRFNDEIKLFECINYSLKNSDVVLNKPKLTKQPNVDILEMKNDNNKLELVLRFEEYMNKNIENVDDPIEVLNYVKGNFINSGYDEYIVFFKQGISYDFEGFETKEDHVKYVECIVLKNDSILQSYPIYGVFGNVNERSPYSSKFGTTFFQGWIGDFNKNGRNELIINCYIKNSRENAMIMVEFYNGNFETYEFLATTDWKYDWGRELFICPFFPSKQIHAGHEWFQGISWSEQLRCYIIIFKVIEDMQL